MYGRCILQCPKGFINNIYTRLCEPCTKDSDLQECMITMLSGQLFNYDQQDQIIQVYYIFNQPVIIGTPYVPPSNEYNSSKFKVNTTANSNNSINSSSSSKSRTRMNRDQVSFMENENGNFLNNNCKNLKIKLIKTIQIF